MLVGTQSAEDCDWIFVPQQAQQLSLAVGSRFSWCNWVAMTAVTQGSLQVLTLSVF
jgi:hypothetical protein